MNGRNIVTREGFRKTGDRVQQLADETADGALALIQEGGYQPSHLSFATLGVSKAFLVAQSTLMGMGPATPSNSLTSRPNWSTSGSIKQSTIMVNRPFSPSEVQRAQPGRG